MGLTASAHPLRCPQRPQTPSAARRAPCRPPRRRRRSPRGATPARARPPWSSAQRRTSAAPAAATPARLRPPPPAAPPRAAGPCPRRWTLRWRPESACAAPPGRGREEDAPKRGGGGGRGHKVQADLPFGIRSHSDEIPNDCALESCQTQMRLKGEES